jgi:hypothetical protein
VSANPEPQEISSGRRPPAGPFVLALLLTVVGVTPLFWVGRYYFRGDTQIAYLGWWYHLGERVREGHLPLMEPLAWEAGNYIAEGQWGLFSPLTILIGLVATVVPNVVVFVTVFKIGLIVLGGIGTYLVARSYGAREPFAIVAGLVVGLSGQSVFIEWPSWVNGQMGAALLPWAWWLIRRAMAGRNPAGALILCYLIAAVGYVYCAMYLAVILLGCLVDAALSRSRRELLTVLALCAFSGLITVAVYLPGVLTSPVTTRDSWAVVGRGRLTMDLQGLFSSMLPTLNRHYLVWLLPVVLWMDLGRLRRSSRDLAGALVATVGLTLWVLGPSAVGPLRWPMRVVPALMVPLVVLLAVVASRCLMTRVSRFRLLLSLAWVCGAAYVVVARDPQQLKEASGGVVLLVGALGMTAWSLGHRGARTTVGVVLVWTVALFVIQYALHPVPPAADRHMPAAPTQYGGRITSASGDVMVLGNAETQIIRNPAIADELLIGASWYFDPKDVQNGYTTINFRRFREKFCRVFNGGTCAGALKALQSTEPTTGRQWVDLLSVSTLVLYRPAFPKTDLMHPPGGWSVSEVTDFTVVWKRDERLATAGGVVATSAHVAVDEESVTDRVVRLRVTTVGSEGGTVTLSRLAWPGYSVEGAELVEPVGGMLVRVAIPAGSAGSTITLRWDPPGWRLELWALSTAVLAGLLWVLLSWLGTWRRHSTRVSTARLPINRWSKVEMRRR